MRPTRQEKSIDSAANQNSSQNELNKALADKTTLEAKILSRQLTPAYERMERYKTFATFSGSAALILAILTAFGSGIGWFYDRSQSREAQANERLQRGISLLASDSAPSRVAGLSVLRGFAADDGARSRQAIAAIADALTVEPDQRVRAALVSFFVESLSPGVPISALEAPLRALVGANRLAAKRYGSWETNPNEELPPSVQAGGELDAMAKAIAGLLRAGARTDLAETFLRNVELHDVDLSFVSFRGADLAGAKLTRTRLTNVDLRDTRLSGADFSFSDLRNANLSFPDRSYGDQRKTNYFLSDLARSPAPRELKISSPKFYCADLRGADLRNVPIFIDAEQGYADSRFFDFKGAKLSDAKFGNSAIWRVVDKDRQSLTLNMEAVWRFPLKDGAELQAGILRESTQLDGRGAYAETAMSFWRPSSFSGLAVTNRLDAAHWHEAVLPLWAKQLMEARLFRPEPPNCKGS